MKNWHGLLIFSLFHSSSTQTLCLVKLYIFIVILILNFFKLNFIEKKKKGKFIKNNFTVCIHLFWNRAYSYTVTAPYCYCCPVCFIRVWKFLCFSTISKTILSDIFFSFYDYIHNFNWHFFQLF